MLTAIGKDLDDLGLVYGTRIRNNGESDQSYRQVIIDQIGRSVSDQKPMKTSYANLNEDGTITIHGIQREATKIVEVGVKPLVPTECALGGKRYSFDGSKYTPIEDLDAL